MGHIPSHHTEADITGLFVQPGAAELGYRQGVVVSFDLTTAANTINVGGTVLTNVAILNLSGSTVLAPGDVVGLLRFKSTYFILGKIIEPPI